MAVPGSFRAFRVHEVERKIEARLETLRLDELAAGDVVIRVAYSSINYKDALAATGAGRILRRYPLVGGIDLAGTVVSSDDPRHRAGDRVLVTGCGLSETHDGGYTEYARVKGEWVIPLPAGLTLFDAMALGTAGFTAALAIHKMEHNGQAPSRGPVVVTGATGGVGTLAIDMLAGRGYEVIAVSGKAEAADWLKSLGAAVRHVQVPFNPEGGAYGQHNHDPGHAHAHKDDHVDDHVDDHGHDHTHDNEHDHEHPHTHDHDHKH